jgi:secreted trypsin-like serine protease
LIGCGGSLIAPNVVLSASHCDTSGEFFIGENVLVGAFRSSGDSDGGAQYVRIEDQKNHPDYSGGTFNYDFMLLRLVESVDFPTVGIPSSDTPDDGDDLTVIGLGVTESGSIANNLREVVVQAVNRGECNQAYGGGITTIMFCAGTSQWTRKLCERRKPLT